jgi:ATP-dependent helicase/nuclease subunit A
LQLLAKAQGCSAALKRAHGLLTDWLARTDRLPVHDQLDHIYFESDLLRRYEAAVPRAMCAGVLANLDAFIQHALDTDAGRYPSLPRFLDELRDLRAAPSEEAPDEGTVGDPGDAVRIYTVHGAKGLQAPVVWVIDSAAGRDPSAGYNAMIAWDPSARTPRHFSLCSRKDELAVAQADIAATELQLAERENLNLLYVAMTRAQQVLIMSGSDGKGSDESWYARVRSALARDDPGDPATPSAFHDTLVERQETRNLASELPSGGHRPVPAALSRPLPTGERRVLPQGRGVRFGVHFHRFMELATGAGHLDRGELRKRLGLAEHEFSRIELPATALLAHPELRRFFDPQCFLRARNEVSFVGVDAAIGRIDRLVEFAEEVWVLDYKSGSAPDDAGLGREYREQVAGYRGVMQGMFGDRPVRAMLIFSDGSFVEVS